MVRPALGIQMLDLSNLSTSDLSQLKLPEKISGGVLVRSTLENMPASDKITTLRCDHKDRRYRYRVNCRFTICPLFSPNNDTIKVTFYRDGKQQTTSIKLTKSTDDLSE